MTEYDFVVSESEGACFMADVKEYRCGRRANIDGVLIVVAAGIIAWLSGLHRVLAHVDVYVARLVEDCLPDEEADFIRQIGEIRHGNPISQEEGHFREAFVL